MAADSQPVLCVYLAATIQAKLQHLLLLKFMLYHVHLVVAGIQPIPYIHMWRLPLGLWNCRYLCCAMHLWLLLLNLCHVYMCCRCMVAATIWHILHIHVDAEFSHCSTIYIWRASTIQPVQHICLAAGILPIGIYRWLLTWYSTC